MRNLPRTLLLVAAAFAGGAVTSHFASANAEPANPYAQFDQLARVLVLVENEYVDPAQRAKILEGAIKGMVAELDPHSAYMPPADFAVFEGETEGQFGGVGIEVDSRGDFVTVIAPIEGSPAERAGIRSGDQILTVDGRPMRGERLDKMVALMRGAPGSKVRIVLHRPGTVDPLTIELAREVIQVKSVVGKRMSGDVAYLRLKQFQDRTHDELLRATAKLRAESSTPLAGVILDMRNNPGGLVDEAEAVADEFISSGDIYSTRHRGKIVDEIKAHAGGAFASLPVVVLVNEYSASAAELVAGALQDNHRATVVGTTTFGKGSVQTIFDLPGGSGLRLTTMRYYTPSGRSIQAEGIRPDIAIQPPSDAPRAEVVRERDLDGHLSSEGALPSSPARVIVATKPADPKAATEDPLKDSAKDLPIDPTRGADFVLSVGYDTLRKAIGEHGPQSP